jgi:hypothetical protein
MIGLLAAAYFLRPSAYSFRAALEEKARQEVGFIAVRRQSYYSS